MVIILNAHPPDQRHLAALIEIIDNFLLHLWAAAFLHHHPHQRSASDIQIAGFQFKAIEGTVGQCQTVGDEVEKDIFTLTGDNIGG